MFTISNFGKALIFAILTVFVAGTAGSAFAAKTQGTKKHAHRHPMKNKGHLKQKKHVKRVAHQGKGKINKTAKLNQKDNQTHQEERALAALNGGDIANPEQPVAIQQEASVQAGK